MEWMDAINTFVNFLGVSDNLFWAVVLGFPVLMLLFIFLGRRDD